MAVKMLKCLIFSFLGGVALAVLVHAQEQSGFFSLDCGTSSDSNYTDKITGIDYMSDAYFIETGVNNKISSAYENYNLEQQLLC
ncbi:putative leucine-rich repeat receptor-like serine/threonine-protein kinase At2g19230 [Pistacia vera]|uniref:putative leucine-rich repeat receptor-like serine/threonine-protein kinase At2g19230 n=1 Tax=Pistacia vera TaxID=55513 RepID=UPI0012635092|nr:putative leucine-rich repeat receptor-like serine/threonine-protein kinase At2g19230 [Pistacia vera]